MHIMFLACTAQGGKEVNIRTKKVIAAVMAVIFLVGVLPYTLNILFGTSKSKQNLQIRVKMSNDQIKNIPIEEYLIGVVAAEMPAEFEVEALKAQAIAARTYVLKKMEKTEGSTYDVDTTEKTQAWNSNEEMLRKWGVLNYWKYRGKIISAVEGTRGEVLKYNGIMIEAVYHSSSGRKNTERADDVWSADAKYLINVSSGESQLRFVTHQIYDCSTFYKSLGFSQIPEQLSTKDIVLIDKTKAGRVKTLAIRNRVVKGTEFRAKLKLPSTDFEWIVQGEKVEIISYGKGHGVGMSQYGANDLAKAGNQYAEILGHYYQGTKLEKLY